MPKKSVFRSENFEEAKVLYPDTVRKLILTVKQREQGRKPRLTVSEIQGMTALGVLRLEVGGGKAARIYITAEAVPFLRATRVADLQTVGDDERLSVVPASGVRRMNADTDTDTKDGIPLRLQSMVAC